jgi:hypothetical protein
LLRSGYLYVYDEARDRWEIYFVTPQAYFLKLAETPGIPPVVPKKPFDCPDEGHRAVASCVTIRDPKRATNVWLAFSDAEWTEAVRAKHASHAHRKKHMRSVDVKSWASSADAAHCMAIAEVEAQVAEYKMRPSALRGSFAWSPFAAEPRQGHAARLVSECERLKPGHGFAVVLEDPVGIAAELAALMQHNLDSFVTADVRKRELAASTAITQIEAAVREQAVALEETAAEDLANQQLAQPDIGMLFEGYQKRRLAQIEQVRTVTPEEARRAEDAAWQHYANKFDDAARKKWQNRFDADLKAHDTQFIAPLAVSHVQWMQSASMAHYFECCFDAENVLSGVVYAKSVQLCIGSSQDKGACFDLYSQWLEGSVADKKNLLLGALALNLDKTRRQIEQAAAVSIDSRSLPWDGLIESFGKATERIGDGHADALGRLIVQVGGPIARLLSKVADGPMRQGVVALGMVSGHPIVPITVVGGKKAFRAMLIRELLKISGTPANQRQMERAVAAELRRLEIRGMKLDGTERKRFLLMVDAEQAGNMPRNLTPQGQAKWLAESVRTPQDVEALNLASWRAKVRNPAAGVLKGSGPFIFGAVTALAQYAAYQKLTEDDATAMAHEKVEAVWRLRAGVGAMAGTITEMLGVGVGKIAVLVPRMGLGWMKLGGDFLELCGRRMGLGGAVIMAAWDLQQAMANAGEGNGGVGLAYGSSSILGIAATAALLLGWTGVGVILVGLVMAVAVLIEYIKDNKIQDWLERCTWGNSQHYPDADTEMRELRIATAA